MPESRKSINWGLASGIRGMTGFCGDLCQQTSHNRHPICFLVPSHAYLTMPWLLHRHSQRFQALNDELE
jgi:hypothetical protein